MTDASAHRIEAPINLPAARRRSPHAIGKQPLNNGGLTRRVKAAIDHIVHDAMRREEGAAAVGLTEDALRRALNKRGVRAYYNEQVEVLKADARPGAARRIVSLMEQERSLKVALDAAKYLDSNGNSDRGGGVTVNVGVQVTPGYVIDLGEDEGDSQMLELKAHGAKPLAHKGSVPE